MLVIIQDDNGHCNGVDRGSNDYGNNNYGDGDYCADGNDYNDYYDNVSA